MQDHVSAWPGRRRGAVSLSFDDGLPMQLTRGVPLLEERGLRGTFYLGPGGEDYAERLTPWTTAFEAGHEVGNHSIGHTCSRNFWSERAPGPVGLEHLSLEEMEADLTEAERRLQELFPTDSRSFAYPCYQTDVGEGVTRQSYVPLVARLFIAGRGVGEYGFFNHPYNVDLHHLGAIAAERMPGTEMVGLVERNVRHRNWAIFAFHSLDGGRLGVNEFDFIELLDHLQENADRIWTAPVAEVARHCVDLRESQAGCGCDA